jgi:predicted GTPase
MTRRRIVILGAAGRDFHNFNVVYRGDPRAEVVAFTATQIPFIAERRYPSELAGPLYPEGIPIWADRDLPDLVRRERINEVVLSYSDLSHMELGHRASETVASGADFRLLGPEATMLRARIPALSVCAVRTGAGKSPVVRRVAALLRDLNVHPVVVRHPMPYGDLRRQRVQRFARFADLDQAACTIEEREEYEPHLEAGLVVFAGVDYAAVLDEAQKDGEVLIWDGGNNDLPFVRPDLELVVVDPLRPGHEFAYFPGEANLLRADAVLVNKVNAVAPESVTALVARVRAANPKAGVILADSLIEVESPDRLRGRRALVIEDGPTLTHGGLSEGAGARAAREAGASLVDPRPHAVGSIRETFAAWSHLGPILPAMGYREAQVRELEETIARTPADVVVVGTPCDLSRLLRLGDRPAVRVRYRVLERDEAALRKLLKEFAQREKPS